MTKTNPRQHLGRECNSGNRGNIRAHHRSKPLMLRENMAQRVRHPYQTGQWDDNAAEMKRQVSLLLDMTSFRSFNNFFKLLFNLNLMNT